MDLEGLAAELIAVSSLFLMSVRRPRQQRREPVERREDLVRDLARLDRPGQRIIAGTRNAPSQLVFFSLRNGVMPPSGHEFMCGRCRCVDHDGVVGDAEIVERLEQLPTWPSCSSMPSCIRCSRCGL
jgi:hypothetical protein